MKKKDLELRIVIGIAVVAIILILVVIVTIVQQNHNMSNKLAESKNSQTAQTTNMNHQTQSSILSETSEKAPTIESQTQTQSETQTQVESESQKETQKDSQVDKKPEPVPTPAPSSSGDDEIVPRNPNPADDGIITVCLDPGHGGVDSGATNGGYEEKDMNLKIALRVRDILEENGIHVIMTREEDVQIAPIRTRVNYAYDHGADYLISIHNNSIDAAYNYLNGCMGIVTRSHYQAPYTLSSDVYQDSRDLASSILNELTAIGIPYTASGRANQNNGLFTRDCTNNETYGDGSLQDYYGIINGGVRYGIPCTIIEHAFVSNASDLQNWLTKDEKLNEIAEADARGILAFLATKQ